MSQRLLSRIVSTILTVFLVICSAGCHDPEQSPGAVRRAAAGPPPAAGYFATKGSGAWSELPSGRRCKTRVHQSDWEPRPANARANHTMPSLAGVRQELTRRRSAVRGHNPRWDRWLVPRITGHYTGTTDEIIQWAACKWGVSDNLLRALAEQESTWYQGLVYPDGRCVTELGCGDLVAAPSAATRKYCDALSRHGRDYQIDYGRGICPETFGIMGVKSWQAPAWGRMPENQNGTFPFNRDSTAFNVDYRAAELRGCLEGWERWLDQTGTRDYGPDRLWGCVGAWYSGDWRTPDANRYIAQVKTILKDRRWLRPKWIREQPPCSPSYGCPVHD